MSELSFAGKITAVLVCVLSLFVSCDISFEDEIVDKVNVSVSRALFLPIMILTTALSQ